MIVFNYPSKKNLRAHIGHHLNYIETSLFGPEYVSTGVLTGANRPHLTHQGREFFAIVTMKNDRIAGVR